VRSLPFQAEITLDIALDIALEMPQVCGLARG
jgi:hypothetical protein